MPAGRKKTKGPRGHRGAAAPPPGRRARSGGRGAGPGTCVGPAAGCPRGGRLEPRRLRAVPGRGGSHLLPGGGRRAPCERVRPRPLPPRSLPGWPDPGEEVGEAAGTTPSVALALVLVRRARLGPGARCGPPRPRGPAERSGPLRPRTAHCRPQGRAAARSLRHVGLRELPWGLSLGKRVLPVAKVLK